MAPVAGGWGWVGWKVTMAGRGGGSGVACWKGKEDAKEEHIVAVELPIHIFVGVGDIGAAQYFSTTHIGGEKKKKKKKPSVAC